jgi:hypothetical protein
MERLILPTRINPFWAKRFTVCARIGKNCYKLFQVLFPNDKDVVYINFPYFPISEGIAAVATLHGNGRSNQQLELNREGRLTSHLVKYTHPADGMAHFSQDGKVRSELRKQSVPLADLDGHMFSAHFSGITQFTKLDGPYPSLNRTTNGGIVLNLDQDPGWIKVMGFWHTRQQAARQFQNYAVNGVIGPMIGDDLGYSTAFLGPWNKGSGGNAILVLQSQTLPNFDPGNSPMQLFIGGFDTDYKVNDLFQDSSVLTFKYPAVDFESLKATMESIDYMVTAREDDTSLGS